MTYDERRTTVVQGTADTVDPPIRRPSDERVVEERHVATVRPGGATMAARVVTLLFGLVQGLIVLRVVLLLLDAREGNALVAGILNLSQVFVGPFDGIFRTNALQAGGSVLDIAAIAALVGWTVVELVVLAILRIPRSGDEV